MESSSTVDTQKVGMATLAAGICFMLGALISSVFDPAWILMIAGFGLLVYAVPKLHEYQAPGDGAIGLWGSRLVAVGGAVVLALGVVFLIWEAVGTPPENDPGVVGLFWMVGFFSFVIGIVLFATASIRAKVFPQAAPILMLAGLVGAVAIDMATGAFFEDDDSTTQWGFFVGVPIFGLGLAWIGNSIRQSPTTVQGSAAGADLEPQL